MMSESKRALNTMRELAELGVTLSIDNFGTGDASLACLKDLPAAEVKIDKSFVTSMGSQRGNPAFVRSIIYLAKALDLSVVAEGVETEASAARLAELGCETAQGYYFARPLTKDAFGEWAADPPRGLAPPAFNAVSVRVVAAGASAPTIQGVPNRSTHMPNIGDQKVSAIGSVTSPPSASASNTRLASSTSARRVVDLHALHRAEAVGRRVVGCHQEVVVDRQRRMHDQVGLLGRHLLVRRHVLHRQQDELAAEDLLVAGERFAAVAAEEQVRVKGHGFSSPMFE